MKRIVHFAAVAAFALAFTVSANAGERKKEDPMQAAQARLIAWQHEKTECYTKAGLEKGTTFIQRDATHFAVRDDVWLAPDKYDFKAIKHCF
jgi:hypothetical protein